MSAEKPPPYPGNPGQPGYPQQPGYPPQPGYPSQQPGYPPQQPGYPPQQPGYPPPGQGPQYSTQPAYPTTTTTTIVQQPAAVVIAPMGFHESPVAMTCPNCQASIVTATEYTTGTLTWLACLGLCIIGCDVGCCLIPFCVDSMKDVVHHCPNCRNQVGVFRRM